MAATGPDAAGQTVAHFRILRELGRGGMGVVYEALDEKLGRTVALKVLPESVAKDPARGARFLREARAAAQIGHAAIATVFEIGEHSGHFYIAMEYVVGATLRAHLAKGPLPLPEALRIARDIASALAKAHALGIVHRDLKPENVMLSADGSVKLLDFGIAKAFGEGVGEGADWNTREGSILGTPGYMAPEQASGQPCDQRADVFAFGVLCHEMLAGHAPFGGATPLALMASVLRDEPTPLPATLSVPEEVRALIARCLEKEPGRRPVDAAEVARTLERFEPTAARAVVRLASQDVDPLAHTLAPPSGPPVVPAEQGESAAGSTAIESAVTHAAEAPARGRSRWVPGLAVVASVSLGALLVGYMRRPAPPATQPPPSTSGAVSSAPPSVASDTRPESSALPPTFTCQEGTDGGFGFRCSKSAIAWCDPAGKQVACCAEGLVPLNLDGACGCPPGGRVGPVPESCPAADGPKGLEADAIRARVGERYADFRRCYELSRGDGAGLVGKVSFALRISFDGRIYSVRIEESALPNAEAQKCLLDVWRTMRFPAPGGTGGVTVVYPLQFLPK